MNFYPFVLTHDNPGHFDPESANLMLWQVEKRAGFLPDEPSLSLRYRVAVDFDGEPMPFGHRPDHGWRPALPREQMDNRLWLTEQQGSALLMWAIHQPSSPFSRRWDRWRLHARKFALDLDASFMTDNLSRVKG